MTLDLLNDCVILPHLANWAHPVRHRRSWATSIASGIDGSEDRAAGRTTPTRKITYTVTGDGIEERSLLAGRIKAALMSGRAVCPLWGRAQACAPGVGTLQVTQGRWPWAAGDWAFLCLPSKVHQHGINSRLRFSCGDYATGVAGEWWNSVNFYVSGGEVVSTAEAIATAHLGDIQAPPQNVLQQARSVDASFGPAEGIRFRVSVPGPQRCKVRLWFAFFNEIVSPDATYRFVAEGNPTASEFNAWTACGGVVNRAGYVDVAATPGPDGTLDFSLYLKTGLWIQVNAIEVFSTCWQMAQIAAVEQTDLTELSFAPEDLLFPDFAEIPQIYPVLFGKPAVGDLGAITNWHGAIEISVEEPLGDAVSGREGKCQVEICGLSLEPPPDPETPPEELEGSSQSAFVVTGGTTVAPVFDDYDLWTEYATALARSEWETWDERASDPHYSIKNPQWIIAADVVGTERVLLVNKYYGSGTIDNFEEGLTTVQATQAAEEAQFLASSWVKNNGEIWWVLAFEVWYQPDPAP